MQQKISATTLKERNTYIKMGNLGKPNCYSARSCCFLYYKSKNEGKILIVFWNAQRQSHVSQLWHGLITSEVTYGCYVVHGILLLLEWLMIKIPLAWRGIIWKGFWIKNWLVASAMQPLRTWAQITYLCILDHILVLIQNKPKDYMRTLRPQRQAQLAHTQC